MSSLNPDVWASSARQEMCHFVQLSGSIQVTCQAEEEEEELLLSAAGYQDTINLAAEAQWCTCGFPSHSGVVDSLCTVTGQSLEPCSCREHQKAAAANDQHQMLLQNFVPGCCWSDVRVESHRCAGVYGEREPDSVDPFWGGSPFIYYGMTRNVIVGVDVVEEVAVEDTLEVITEDVYADDLLDVGVLEEHQLYPT